MPFSTFIAMPVGSFGTPCGCILQVTLGQKKGQAMRVVSRCLWDTHSDASASELYENETLYCVCQVSPQACIVDPCIHCVSSMHVSATYAPASVFQANCNIVPGCLQVYGLYYE